MKRLMVALNSLLLVLTMSLTLHAAEHRGLEVVFGDETGQQVGMYEKSYALVIGVSEYKTLPDLPGVKKDIAAVKKALEEHGFHVTLVENPTDRSELDQVFVNFIDTNGQKQDDRLLFYFAGHGHTLRTSYGGEMGYIVPTDAPNPNQDVDGFRATALDMQMIEVYAKRIQAKHALFVFDSCFSGSIFALSKAIPEHISYRTGRHVRQFITSGSADEQVPDDGLFRQQFVEALEGEADWDSDGYVTGLELGEFLQRQIVNYSRGAQHPQYGKIRDPLLDKGDFVFQLPVATVTIESLPPGAAICIDGGQLKDKETPAMLKLPIGEHTLELEELPMHRRSTPQIIQLSPGVNPVVIVPLKPKMGTLDITSTPDRGTIRVNGELEAQTTPAKLTKPPGKYTITVERDDSDPYTVQVTLIDQQVLEVKVSLPEQTQLHVTSNPPGSMVSLGKLGVHHTPAVLRAVKPGDYEARATMRGYRTTVQQFTVSPHTRNRLEIQLFPVSRVHMAWRSLLLPGWGQYYGGHYSSGTTFLLAGLGAATGATVGYLLYNRSVDDYNNSVVRYDNAFTLQEVELASEAMIDAHEAADSRFVLRQAMFIAAGVVWGINMAHVFISGPSEVSEPLQEQVELPHWRLVPRMLPHFVGVTLAGRF